MFDHYSVALVTLWSVHFLASSLHATWKPGLAFAWLRILLMIFSCVELLDRRRLLIALQSSTSALFSSFEKGFLLVAGMVEATLGRAVRVCSWYFGSNKNSYIFVNRPDMSYCASCGSNCQCRCTKIKK